MLYQTISLRRGNAVDAEARIYLQAQHTVDLREINGQLTGPYCKFARTLPTSFALRPLPDLSGQACLAEVLVTDPCFWTPQLPFLYDLKLNLTTQSSESITYETSVGIKRWYVEGVNWTLEGRRVVFRGAKPIGDLVKVLTTAREAETALLVPPQDETTLVSANRIGVPLLIDLRDTIDQAAALDRLLWSPAVMAVILDADQLGVQPASAKPRSGGPPLGLAVDTRSRERDFAFIDFDFYTVEIASHERPPSWLASVDRPVVVIRRGVQSDGLQQARAACDNLQAELAPEFDFSGYFVTP